MIHPRTSVATAEFAAVTSELLKLLPKRDGGNLRHDSLRETLRSAGKWILLLLSAFIRFFFRRFLVVPASFIPRVRDMDMKRLRGMGLGVEVCWL